MKILVKLVNTMIICQKLMKITVKIKSFFDEFKNGLIVIEEDEFLQSLKTLRKEGIFPYDFNYFETMMKKRFNHNM